ncbi:uncharacterized protein FFB14_15851 [Fusarium fujikuroi]|jgi:hypothetical protein
MQYL